MARRSIPRSSTPEHFRALRRVPAQEPMAPPALRVRVACHDAKANLAPGACGHVPAQADVTHHRANIDESAGDRAALVQTVRAAEVLQSVGGLHQRLPDKGGVAQKTSALFLAQFLS